MLPKDMWELLLSHHIHVIALGDPAQLPPITEDNGVLAKPHIFLDEIVRQAQDNEIIKLSMNIREGKPLQLFNGNQVKVIEQIPICRTPYTSHVIIPKLRKKERGTRLSLLFYR